jgi:hypothetical protein
MTAEEHNNNYYYGESIRSERLQEHKYFAYVHNARVTTLLPPFVRHSPVT